MVTGARPMVVGPTLHYNVRMTNVCEHRNLVPPALDTDAKARDLDRDRAIAVEATVGRTGATLANALLKPQLIKRYRPNRRTLAGGGCSQGGRTRSELVKTL